MRRELMEKARREKELAVQAAVQAALAQQQADQEAEIQRIRAE